MLSCVNIYVIDLMYKIQAACGPESLKELNKENLHIKDYGFFEFKEDEKSPKNHNKFIFPLYFSVLLQVQKEWSSTINDYIIPLIKKYEGKLLCKEPIKPKIVLIMSNEIKNGQNSLMDKIDDKIRNEESSNHYNDINYWKMENTLSNNIKENVESRKDIKPDDNDDEDELLNIAIKL